MPVTIRDIGRELGISHATVSRVLNNKEEAFISDKTRERVWQAARELGYVPNMSARALTTGRTYAIGLYAGSIEERTDPHFTAMLGGVEPKARSLGYTVSVFGDVGGMLGKKVVDGVIALADPNDPNTDASLIEAQSVFVAPLFEVSNRCIAWSDADGVYEAVRYLLDLGHRSIAGVFGSIPPEVESSNQKIAGFQHALQEAGESCLKISGNRSEDHFINGYLLAKELLQDRKDITAIFARNDVLAMGAMRAVREAGLVMPRDMSIIGYSDTIVARCADPGLTSVRTPIIEAGRIAVEQLIRILHGEISDFLGIKLSTSLTERESCGPPRR